VYGKAFYDTVADALTGFLPPSLRDFEWYRSSHNLKLWYGDEGREHYEVQIIKRGKILGLEIGFHAEHKDATRNENAIAKLLKVEKRWRAKLGKDPEAGAFIGTRFGNWRRISEVWDSVNDDPGVAVDAAERLASYIQTLEPLRANSRISR
jgi:hypothetical protein